MRPPLLLAALVGCALAGCEAGPSAASPDASFETVAEASLMEAPAMEPAEADVGTESAAAVTESARLGAEAEVPDAALASRQLRRSADLRVATATYEQTLADARALAARYGGLVAGEDGHADADGTGRTTLTLRVPAARFDAALDALAALGTVESRSVAVDDVTGQVVDLEARLRAKRAAEARYVALVAETGTVAEMLAVQERLDGLRAEIESMESVARALQGSVALTTIRATFVGPTAAPVGPAAPGVLALAADAVAAGWHGFVAVVLALIPLWPLAALAGAGLAVWRRLRPRLAA